MFPGGYASILSRLAKVIEAAGVEVRLSSPISKVARKDKSGVTVELADGTEHFFDRVILTTPTPVVAKVCPQLTPKEQERFRGIEYQGIVCASLLLKKPISSYYVTNITDPGIPLTGIIEMTTIVDNEQFGGNHLVYLPKYVPAKDPIFERPDHELKEQFISTLEKMYSQFNRDDIVAFRMSKVRNVVAVPTLNYSERLPSMETSIPGLFAVNSAHILKGNLNVNETVEIAWDAMRNIFQPIIDSQRQPSSIIDAAVELVEAR